MQEESKPAPALIFGGESVCMYAKAVTLSLRSGLCGALYDVTIEGTNSPARTGFRTLVVVSQSSWHGSDPPPPGSDDVCIGR